MEGVIIMPEKEWRSLQDEIASLKTIIIDMGKKSKQEDPLMDLKEVASYLKKSYIWVFNNKSKIGASRVGGDWLIRKSSVDQYINQSYHKDN